MNRRGYLLALATLLLTARDTVEFLSTGKGRRMIRSLLIAASLLFTVPASAATTWYVDSATTGANTGTNWADAWPSVASITGVQGGDTVYVSGGPSGSSRAYPVSGFWTLVNGTSGHPTTYQIGQDSEHNGTATFSGGGYLFGPAWGTLADVVFSGDASDGQRHFAVSGFDGILYDTLTDVRLSYVNFGNMGGYFSGTAFGGSANGLEFDHNYIYMNGAGTDSVMRVGFSGTGYDQSLIHHNFLYAPSNPTSPAMGADGLQMSGDGFSIFDNVIINYRWAGWNISVGQHSDGWQTGGGTYIKLYNNFIYGFGDIGIYGGCWGNAVTGGSHVFSHVRIYNNVVDSYDMIVAGSISVEADDPTGSTFDDIVIANNISRDPPHGNEIDGYYGDAIFVGSGKAGGIWTNISVVNNLMIAPKAYNSLAVNAMVSSAHNVWVTDAQLAPLIVDFQPTAATSNYHYTSAASALIEQGQDLSAYFLTDKDGVARPQGAAWDIGAYEYCASGCASPDAGVPLRDAGVAADAASSHADAATPSFSIDQCVAASAGTMTSPMAVVNDSTATGGQYVATSVTNQGAIVFAFEVPTAGDYLLQAEVRSPDTSYSFNSFFVGLDGEAALGDDTKTYDTKIATTFTWDDVRIRGNGTDTAAQYDPKTWMLTQGLHSFTFYGRESGTELVRVALRSCGGSGCVSVATPTCGGSLVDGGPANSDAGQPRSDGGAAGTDGGVASHVPSGCGCALSSSAFDATTVGVLMLAMVAVVLRRRRSHR